MQSNQIKTTNKTLELESDNFKVYGNENDTATTRLVLWSTIFKNHKMIIKSSQIRHNFVVKV